MFAKTQMGGCDFAMPDVCLTPIPSPAGPIPTPIPYPNIALTMTAIPNQKIVFTLAMFNHNLLTITPISNGDNPGALGGVISGIMMGPSRHLCGSTNVFYSGAPATKMLSPTGQNGMSPNAFGASLAPSQVKVMIMR